MRIRSAIATLGLRFTAYTITGTSQARIIRAMPIQAEGIHQASRAVSGSGRPQAVLQKVGESLCWVASRASQSPVRIQARMTSHQIASGMIASPPPGPRVSQAAVIPGQPSAAPATVGKSDTQMAVPTLLRHCRRIMSFRCP